MFDNCLLVLFLSLTDGKQYERQGVITTCSGQYRMCVCGRGGGLFKLAISSKLYKTSSFSFCS